MGTKLSEKKLDKKDVRKVRLARKQYLALRKKMLGIDDWNIAIAAAGKQNTASVNSLLYEYAKEAGKLIYVRHKASGYTLPGILTDLEEKDSANLALCVSPGNFRIVRDDEMNQIEILD